MTVGGVDTYYDYDERQWKFRRLGGGPVRESARRPATQRAAVVAQEPVAPADAPAKRAAHRHAETGKG
ncbi:hypothetical protein ABZX12_25195 [Kribbella sp. NPDC003505]|uniref:hypothetical protein n=1 Tax=Kribbella sp. NPDC003505 TaxID=3154448 RepID=UPI0033B3608E